MLITISLNLKYSSFCTKSLSTFASKSTNWDLSALQNCMSFIYWLTYWRISNWCIIKLILSSISKTKLSLFLFSLEIWRFLMSTLSSNPTSYFWRYMSFASTTSKWFWRSFKADVSSVWLSCHLNNFLIEYSILLIALI